MALTETRLFTGIQGPVFKTGVCMKPVHSRMPHLHCIQQKRVGDSELTVSEIALGTMLFGESTSFETACEMMNMAFEKGVTFLDTAEMYPVPQRPKTQGRSEEFIGRWIQTGNIQRDQVVIGTKVAGPSGEMKWIRDGPLAIDKHNIFEAVDASLRRLQTDYIDLLQLHWPDRYVPMFGAVDYDPSYAYKFVPIEDQLDALGQCIEQGKVRYVGLSNESAWGLTRFTNLAHHNACYPKVVSLQNAYRTFDSALAECCHMEKVGLLAYSPLAMGLLTGKYLSPDGGPPDARLNKYKGRYAEAESRYGPKPNVKEAVSAYVELAKDYGMSPVHLALRFALDHPLIASVIVGAANPGQLKELLESGDHLPLCEELRSEIDQVHQRYPNPTP